MAKERTRISIKPEFSGTTTVTGEVVSAELAHRGGGDEKYQLVVRLDSGKEIALFERPFPDVSTGMTDHKAMNLYVTNWQRLRAAGLPVVPTLRLTDRMSLVMTDMTQQFAGSAQLYGKSRYVELTSEALKPDDLTPTDQKFLTITEGLAEFLEMFFPRYRKARAASFLDGSEQLHRLWQELSADSPAVTLAHPVVAAITDVAKRANQEYLLLPHDDPAELVVHDEGFDILLLDLMSQVELKSRKHTTWKNNFNSLVEFLLHLTKVRGQLLNT